MSGGNLEITMRGAMPADAPALAALGEATFTEAFGHLYSGEDLREFIVAAHSVEAWSRKLSDPQGAVWVAVLADATPIGFAAVGSCKLPMEEPAPQAGEIHQLYVLARCQNLGVGTRLMDVGFQWLEAHGRAPLYVGVWSQNIAAQRFYSRYGFDKVGEYGFAVGSAVDREFILRRSPAPEACLACQGPVQGDPSLI